MYAHWNSKQPNRDLDELTFEEHKFVGCVAVRIPRLIKAIMKGTTLARYKLGAKCLDDGRRVELELVAWVHEDKQHGIAKSLGQTPPQSPGDREA